MFDLNRFIRCAQLIIFCSLLSLFSCPSHLQAGDSIAPALASGTVKDPNAALRWLTALGLLQKPPEKTSKEISALWGRDSVSSLSDESRYYFLTMRERGVFRMTRLAAAQPACNFVPDNDGGPNDVLPPFFPLNNLGEILIVEGWIQDEAGKTKDALELFEAVYTLGQHLGNNPFLMAAQVPVGLREQALMAMKKVLQKHAEPAWRNEIQSFLRRQPRPAFDLASYLLQERIVLRQNYAEARANPRSFWHLEPLCDWEDRTIRAADPDQRLNICHQQQRRLAWAVERASWNTREHGPLPTSSDELKKRLLDLQYVATWPVCPENGTYTVFPDMVKSSGPICSVHSRFIPGDVPEGELMKKALAEYQAFSKTPQFDQMASEALAFWEDAIRIVEAPTPQEREKLAQAWDDRKDASPNRLLRNSLSKIHFQFERQRKLEETLDALLKP